MYIYYLLFIYLYFHTCIDVLLWVFQERQVYSNQDLLPLLATSKLGVLDWDLWYIFGHFIVYGHYVVCKFCHKLPKGEIVRIWVCSVGKSWQKVSFIELEWWAFKSKTKNSSSGWKKWDAIWFSWLLSIAVWSVKSHKSAKTNKHKKPITWPFQAQIVILFLQYLKDIIS